MWPGALSIRPEAEFCRRSRHRAACNRWCRSPPSTRSRSERRTRRRSSLVAPGLRPRSSRGPVEIDSRAADLPTFAQAISQRPIGSRTRSMAQARGSPLEHRCPAGGPTAKTPLLLHDGSGNHQPTRDCRCPCSVALHSRGSWRQRQILRRFPNRTERNVREDLRTESGRRSPLHHRWTRARVSMPASRTRTGCLRWRNWGSSSGDAMTSRGQVPFYTFPRGPSARQQRPQRLASSRLSRSLTHDLETEHQRARWHLRQLEPDTRRRQTVLAAHTPRSARQ